jgi:hypothetical protein
MSTGISRANDDNQVFLIPNFFLLIINSSSIKTKELETIPFVEGPFLLVATILDHINLLAREYQVYIEEEGII